MAITGTAMRLALALVLILAAGCASAPAGTQSILYVDVSNDMVPPSTVDVYLVPETGIERHLGTITSGRHNLRYNGLAPVGNHRLAARRTNGSTIWSSTLVLDGVTALQWSLMSNLVRITATRSND